MSNQNRVQQGIPTGGQFATTQRGEADVDLGAGKPATMLDGVLLTSATPPAIDDRLADLDAQRWEIIDIKTRLMERLHSEVGDKREYGWGRGQRRGVWTMSNAEVMDRADDILSRGGTDQASEQIRSTSESYAAADTALVANGVETKPFNDEFYRRGGWNRAYLVDNTDGHVHNSMRCSTCHNGESPTRLHWVTEMSGASETEIVEEAGERACTTCYPSAPVSALNRPSRIEGPNQRATREEADARAAEKSARRAKAQSEQVIDQVSGEQLFKTERGATNFVSGELQSSHWYGPTHPSYAKWQRESRQAVNAVAAKRGVDPEELWDELNAKAAKKVAKDRQG